MYDFLIQTLLKKLFSIFLKTNVLIKQEDTIIILIIELKDIFLCMVCMFKYTNNILDLEAHYQEYHFGCFDIKLYPLTYTYFFMFYW